MRGACLIFSNCRNGEAGIGGFICVLNRNAVRCENERLSVRGRAMCKDTVLRTRHGLGLQNIGKGGLPDAVRRLAPNASSQRD
jgi:hypothetical protein